MGQFLVQSRREGKPFWRTFWLGGTIAGGGQDERSPGFDAPFRRILPAMVWGLMIPWNLLASVLLGIWVVFAPAVFGTFGTPFAHSDHPVGALGAVVAVIAMAEVARAVRYVNVLAGIWIDVAPWLLPGATTIATWHDVVVGVALALLSIPRGLVAERYGSLDRYIV